jgi:hypothetical protein
MLSSRAPLSARKKLSRKIDVLVPTAICAAEMRPSVMASRLLALATELLLPLRTCRRCYSLARRGSTNVFRNDADVHGKNIIHGFDMSGTMRSSPGRQAPRSGVKAKAKLRNRYSGHKPSSGSYLGTVSAQQWSMIPQTHEGCERGKGLSTDTPNELLTTGDVFLENRG